MSTLSLLRDLRAIRAVLRDACEERREDGTIDELARLLDRRLAALWDGGDVQYVRQSSQTFVPIARRVALRADVALRRSEVDRVRHCWPATESEPRGWLEWKTTAIVTNRWTFYRDRPSPPPAAEVNGWDRIEPEDLGDGYVQIDAGPASAFHGIDRSVAPPRHGKLRTHIVPTPRGQHQVTYYDEALTIDYARLREVLKGVMMQEPRRPIEWASPVEYERRALQHWDLAKEPLRFLRRWAAVRRRVGGDDIFDRTITPIPQEVLDYADRMLGEANLANQGMPASLLGRYMIGVDLGHRPSTGHALMIWTDEPKDATP